jgi:hypothetical protein
MSKYNTNLAAEYYVLSTLYRLGVDAFLTLGNKKSVDIIIIKGKQGILTVDVKGLVAPYGWPATNIKKKDKRHYYVLVCYESKIDDPSASPSTWIVPAPSINKFIREYGDRSVVSRSSIRKNGGAFKENWKVFQ